MPTSVITRNGRFLLGAILPQQIGRAMKAFIQRRLGLVTGVFAIAAWVCAVPAVAVLSE